MELPADLRDVVAEVLSQVPRLIALQDRDPDSPMRGCMHPAYWRDKSSDVADMRRQEAGLAFAWAWKHPFPDNRWQGDATVLHAALRALGFWTRQQHPDGTFDEWYKNEHGYATTAFSSYAMSLAVEALGDALADPLRGAVLGALSKCGRWLESHDDWFKTNHQAVGVAALGAIGRVTNDESLLAAARRNARAIVDRMHDEGWSREISGLDVGYTFLLAEYLAMHAVLTGERDFLPDIARAYRFAAWFLHPDLTTGAEYGICGNPYFSRVAATALAPHDGIAAATVSWMGRPSDGPRDTSSTLKDDLRLARYAYQPLLAALLHSGTLAREDLDAAGPDAETLFFEREHGEQWFPEAKLLAVARPAYCAWVAPCHGGVVRVAFRNADGFHPAFVDRGYALDHRGRTYRNAHYGLDVDATFEGGVLTTHAPLVRCGFVMPPYWARVGLRIATSLPAGHRWSRWLIDQWRRRKGTALNQSAAGVASGKSPFTLRREVRFLDDRVRIDDVVSARNGILDRESIHLVVRTPLRLVGGMPDPDGRLKAQETVSTASPEALHASREIALVSGSVVSLGTAPERT
ncbi:MAG: hypothetical protein CMJ83_15150 [Planctomycetes bacterium]|nr:hypothetical protein [Planctomycetota bacterium]